VTAEMRVRCLLSTYHLSLDRCPTQLCCRSSGPLVTAIRRFPVRPALGPARVFPVHDAARRPCPPRRDGRTAALGRRQVSADDDLHVVARPVGQAPQLAGPGQGLSDQLGPGIPLVGDGGRWRPSARARRNRRCRPGGRRLALSAGAGSTQRIVSSFRTAFTVGSSSLLYDATSRWMR
jgi:hypothetical protein